MIIEILNFIVSPMGFIIIPLLIIMINSFRKYNNYLDIRQIIIKQWKMFKDNKISFAILYILPIFIAIGIARIKSVNTEIINNVNVVLSILIAMFFSVFSIIMNFNNDSSENYKITLQETNNTIMFEIVLSVFLLIFTFIYMFIENIKNQVILNIMSFTIYYLSLVVLINIFMIMKRMYILYETKNNSNYSKGEIKKCNENVI